MRIPLRAVCVRGSAPCANGRPRTEVTMQISTRSLSVLVLVLLAAACGSTSDSNNMPAANGGGVVQGTVMGGSQNMRVAVLNSSAATTTDSAGGFVLTGVPKGAAALQFSGAGQNATLATAPMVSGEFRRLTVSISGSSATEHNEQTETEFEGIGDAIVGTVTQIAGNTLTVDGVTVNVGSATMIVKGDTTLTLADLKVGDRLLVRGAVQADRSINATRIRVLPREDEAEEMHVSGQVTAVGANSFTIGDSVIAVDARTEFEDGLQSLADLKVGDFVLAEVVRQADGSLLAEEVKKFTPPPG